MSSLISMLGLGVMSLFGYEEEFYLDRISQIESIDVDIVTTTTMENDAEATIPGAGFIFGHYLFTLDHVTSRYSFQTQVNTPFGMQTKTFPIDRDKIKSEITTLDDRVLYPVIEDQESDIAIFDLSKDELLCNTYCNDLTEEDLMLEEDLYKGQEVYWIGSPKSLDGYYKESRISLLRDEVDEGKYEGTYMLQHTIIPGSSGKPVWSNGKITGVAQYIWQSHAGVKFMDKYLDEIKDYERGTE